MRQSWALGIGHVDIYGRVDKRKRGMMAYKAFRWSNCSLGVKIVIIALLARGLSAWVKAIAALLS